MRSRSRRRLRDLGEEALVERIRAQVRTDRTVILGIGDDCAVLAGGPGWLELFACDMLIEGVHFLRGAAAAAVGWKALAVNVSDVAAMGGLPKHAVVSLGLPPLLPVSYLDGLYRGLRRCASRFGVNLVGGDTNRSDRIVVDVAILGEVERRRLVTRSGARPGDALLVTGRLGGAVRSGRHLRFTPRVREARRLGSRAKIHAMIDLSDGLLQDLQRICRASGAAAVLESGSIPRNPGCSLAQAMTDGEDFELLLAVPQLQADRLLRWAQGNLRCGLTRIGQVVRPRGRPLVEVRSPGGARIPLPAGGFQHFSR